MQQNTLAAFCIYNFTAFNGEKIAATLSRSSCRQHHLFRTGVAAHVSLRSSEQPPPFLLEGLF